MNAGLGLGLGIRRRIIVFLLLLLFVLLFPSILIIRHWMSSSRDKVAEDILKERYNFITLFLDSKKSSLEVLAKAHASDPDVLNCFKEHGPDITSFFNTLKRSYGLGFILVLDAKGKVVGGDAASKRLMYDSFISADTRLVESKDVGVSSGFLHTSDDRLWIVAFSEIAADDDPARTLGSIVFGAALDDALFNGLSSDFLMSSVTGEKGALGSFESSRKELVYAQQPFRIVKGLPDSNESAIFYLDALIRDIRGEAVGIIRIKEDPSDIWSSNKPVVFILGIALLIFLFFSWLMVRFVTRYITSPLVRLKAAIIEVISSRNLSKRLDIGFEDEVVGLNTEFNRMLDELEKMNLKIKRSAEEMGVLYKDLLEQKKFTSEILAIAPSIVLVLLPDARVKFVNDSIERITGYKSEEIIGRDWFDMMLSFGKRKAAKAVFEDLAQGKVEPHKQIEYNVLTKNNTERIILWSNNVLLDKDGRVSSVISIGQDITEHKHIETELVKKINDLERFYKVTMNRERVVIQLKEELRELKTRPQDK
ncbi:MAG: PAS domain S-box protein [Candidatus Omnitrophota bacterium]